MERIAYSFIESEFLGKVYTASTEKGVCRIDFLKTEEEFLARFRKKFGLDLVRGDRENRDALGQIREYLRGNRKVFDFPLDFIKGTPFQRNVWDEVGKVPYGETRSYGDIAEYIGNPKACRAVGAANGTNPLPIVIPCHRIIGKDGGLCGFGHGLPAKNDLLAFEKSHR
jgi:O-6-methylguanine DNA methyltransferase